MHIIAAVLFLAANAAPVDPATIAKVDAVFAAYAHPTTPGCAVGVARAGTPLLERAYGEANLEYDVPLTTSSIFEVGSVSKQFTAAAVILLEQDGKLSLQDKVRKWIPELDPSAAEVTLLEMLNHTSGLRDWGTVSGIAGWPRGSRVISHAHVLDILSKQRALNFPAGTRYSYCNSNFNLGAIVVERASGQTFPDFVAARIFKPLGMTHSSWRDDYSRVVKGRATAYEPGRGETFHTDMDQENIYGNCCLLTTVGDLLKWNDNFRTHLVGGGALASTMQTPGKLADGKTITYATGLFIEQYRGHREVSHGGATAGWRAFLMRLPQDDELSVAVICNRGDANSSALAHRVADAFLPAAPETKPPTATPAAALRFAGLYRDLETDAVLRIFADAKGALHAGFGDRGPALIPVSSSRFKIGSVTNLDFDASSVRLTNANGRDAHYTRVEPASPAPDRLTEYAGTYRSEEAGATYVVAVNDGKLTARVAVDQVVPLEPTDADGFHAGGATLIRFTRNAEGRVDGAEVKTDFSMVAATARVERMVFIRMP